MNEIFKRTSTIELILALVSLCLSVMLVAAPIAYADDSSSTPDTSTPDTTTQTPDTTDNSNTQTPDTSDTSDAPQPSATVTTGDASSDAEVNNTTNNNQTDSDAASTTVTDTNDATTTNDTSSGATTGANIAVSSGGGASVSTGQAISQANVINVVNANITNSQGLIEFLNAFNAGGYDLNNLDLSYFDNSLSNSACSFSSCNGSTLNVSNTNNATVTNTVLSEASTGGNTASTTDGDASVSTGDAAASANVVNVVNTNITDSHYLLVALNNFGDLAGNIVLPNADFFNQLMAQNAKTGNTSVTNDNTADVNSTTTADADTGDNSATSTGGDASVSTGNALSNSTTFNQVNTNLTGGSTVFLLVNVFGNWTGNIQGLPSGLSWAQTQNGIAITGGSGALSTLGGGTTTVSNTNTATVNNDVQVYALTGQNEASSASGTADVATGNAYASANVVNLVNTNILGQNWILAILNVFGDWSGNLDFGQPDLWIGAVAQTTNPTQPGSQVVYTFTVANHGDVDATDVVLNTQFDPTMLTFDSGMTGTGAQWNLGTIPAGQTMQFSYTATAGNPPSGETVSVPLVATITEDQDDANTDDNTDNVTIAVGDQFNDVNGGLRLDYQDDPQLIVHKTASIAQSTTPATVNYTVTVEDPDSAGPAYNATLTDTLTDPNGKVIYNNSWDLDTINPGDDITLTYSVDFDASSTPGAYLDTSTVTGDENYQEEPYANVMPPATAVSAFQILPTGEVLGASTSNAQCSPLLTSYITQGGTNNPAAVASLQWFLNTFENAALKVSRVYDSATVAAVEAFQQKYAADILTPWGMTTPSGNVYYTTENEINNIVCGSSQFSLTPTQQEEIKGFKSGAGGTYGSAKTKSNFAAKPKKGTSVIVGEPTSTPVVVTPQHENADSILEETLSNFASEIGVPFAQAASRN